MSQEYECGYCQDTGEVACSSSSYIACPECKARREKAASMTPIPPIPELPDEIVLPRHVMWARLVELERENTRLKAPVTTKEANEMRYTAWRQSSWEDWARNNGHYVFIEGAYASGFIDALATRTPPQEGQ
jgi:hypothetical protein